MRAEQKIYKIHEIARWRGYKASGSHVVVTNGCFDILHVGHTTYLEAAKGNADYLLVGINSDRAVKLLKGDSRPINSEMDRALVVAALECVDAVCIFDDVSAANFLRLAKPDTWAKGGDYSSERIDVDELQTVRNGGGNLRIIPMVPGKSTTAVVEKLKIL